MTYKQANKLRLRILETGLHCTRHEVCGNWHVKIYPCSEGLVLRSWRAFEKYCEQRDAQRPVAIPRPKNAIEAMIDQACGVKNYHS